MSIYGMLLKQLRMFCMLKDIGPLFEHCQYHDRKSGTDVYIHVCIHEHVNVSQELYMHYLSI